MPKMSTWIVCTVICTACPLRWCSAQSRGTSIQVCFLLLFLSRACAFCKSVVKFYSLPTQCVENIAGGFA